MCFQHLLWSGWWPDYMESHSFRNSEALCTHPTIPPEVAAPPIALPFWSFVSSLLLFAQISGMFYLLHPDQHSRIASKSPSYLKRMAFNGCFLTLSPPAPAIHSLQFPPWKLQSTWHLAHSFSAHLDSWYRPWRSISPSWSFSPWSNLLYSNELGLWTDIWSCRPLWLLLLLVLPLPPCLARNPLLLRPETA